MYVLLEVLVDRIFMYVLLESFSYWPGSEIFIKYVCMYY